jgi:hypothetical protein
MRAATLRVRSHMFAVSRLFDLLRTLRGNRHTTRHDNLVEDSMTDDMKRDLGLMDGRRGVGSPRERQSDEMLEALLRQPRPL